MTTTSIMVREVCGDNDVFYGFEIVVGNNLYVVLAGTDKIKHNGISPDIEETLTYTTILEKRKTVEALIPVFNDGAIVYDKRFNETFVFSKPRDGYAMEVRGRDFRLATDEECKNHVTDSLNKNKL